MLVSIIINSYNYGAFLHDAIDSALLQTYQNIEVVVVDDGSDDDSRDIITSYGKRVTAILQSNGGQASAFNAGFAASQGEVVCMLDSDDAFLPEKVAQLVRVFEMEQGYSWCFDRLRCVDANAQAIQGSVQLGTSHECDYRSDVRSGKLFFSAPATSGLSFRRSFLANILPMPEATGISLSDEYLKVASIGMGKGFYLAEGYTLQRIHSRNAYTSRTEKDRLTIKSHIQLLTSCALKANFPELNRFTDKLFARAIALSWLAGGFTRGHLELSREYFFSAAIPRKLGIASRTAYHYLRYFAQSYFRSSGSGAA